MNKPPYADKFTPLTVSERAAVPAGGDAACDECAMPVPANAPAPPDVHPQLGKLSARWSYRDAAGALLFEVWRFDPAGGKEIRPLSIWRDASGALRWRWKAVPAQRPLYAVDQLAANPGASVVVCEGEKAADAAARIFPESVCVTSPGGSQSASKADWKPLAGRRVLIWPDADEPGAKYAGEVAAILHGQDCDVSIIDAVALASLPLDGGSREPGKGWDAADAAAEWENLGALREAAVGLAKPLELQARFPNGCIEELGETDSEIARLAKLCAADYERERRSAAKRLDIRAAILDKLVAAARPHDEGTPGQGRPLELCAPEPWPSAVNGAALVAELAAAIRKYVVLTENDGLTVALWVLHSYCFDAFPCTPRLAITAPEKRCGKTTLLDVIALLVMKALATANISAAALFRTVELARPILLIDEADTFLGENEELRGILNSGHRAGGQVIRTVGEDFEPRAFSTHCPVAIAQIGKLPGTLADRSIHILMKRRASGEPVTRFRFGRTPELAECARKAVRWVADNADQIRECDPAIPEAIFNRAADNWEPLLAIAKVAGGDILERASTAALASCGIEEEQSYGAMLLADIRAAFDERSCDRMTSKDLVDALVAMTDRPWGECNHGKALTQNQLARRVKKFGIHTKKIRVASGFPVQGYELAAFADSFSRYIPGFQSGTPEQPSNINDLGKNKIGTRSTGGPLQNQPKSLKSFDCSCVPVQKGDAAKTRVFRIFSAAKSTQMANSVAKRPTTGRTGFERR